MSKFLLDANNAFLLIIDIQERLAAAMSQREKVVENTLHLVELAKFLDIPIVITEQYPKGLGGTLAEIIAAVPVFRPLEKVQFSCCGATEFGDEINMIGRDQVIITGMETHVCVLQTALDLLNAGYDVHIVADAICSRTKDNWKSGLQLMRDAGAVITSTEITLFQLLKVAGTEAFKMVSKRIK